MQAALSSDFQNPPPALSLPREGGDADGSLLGNSKLQVIVIELPPGSAALSARRARRRPGGRVEAFRRIPDSGERARTEFRWLAENRERYAGRWVALEGDMLLAVGDSAREVYAAIADREGTPLVTRVEPEEEAYFAGW